MCTAFVKHLVHTTFQFRGYTTKSRICWRALLPPEWLLLGSPMIMDPHPNQQHAGLHHAVWQLQQEVTKPKARFKPTSPEKSGVNGGANQVPAYLGQSLHLYSPWWSSLAIITSNQNFCPFEKSIILATLEQVHDTYLHSISISRVRPKLELADTTIKSSGSLVLLAAELNV